MKRILAVLAVCVMLLAGCAGNEPISVQGTYFTVDMPGRPTTDTREQSIPEKGQIVMTVYSLMNSNKDELYMLTEVNWKDYMEKEFAGDDAMSEEERKEISQIVLEGLGAQETDATATEINGLKAIALDMRGALEGLSVEHHLNHVDGTYIETDQAAFLLVYAASDDKYSEETKNSFFNSFKAQNVTNEWMGLGQ